MSLSDQEDDNDSPDESPFMDPLLTTGEKVKKKKKAVYEPSSSRRYRQLVCSRRWTVVVLVTMGLFVLLIAVIAASARPGSMLCQNLTGSHSGSQADTMTTPAPPRKEKTYISSDGRPFPWRNIRLPRSVLPESYKIFLHPNISQSMFSGKVIIRCSVVDSADFFVFHVKDLNVTKVTVLRGEVGVKVSDHMEYKDNEQYYVELEQVLAPDSKITIVVEFRGALVKKLAGFYKSSYQTDVGETREIATTQFEPTDARAAFPCFDEPDLKANFSLSIVREKRHITLFNMPLENTTPYEDDLLQDDFETSVKMSTYLVAFVVCDFKNVTAYTDDDTMVRVFAPEDQINQADYALDIAVQVLNFYSRYFGVPYPLPKQDMIAIPDFAAGAMENWGLITYRMTSILYDPQKTSPLNKQWITTDIAHELAHQWFGNLVTMKWWDDLWLKEGFAEFIQNLGSQQVEPSFSMEEQSVYKTQQKALNLDSFTSSHPIQTPVSDPAKINEIFDTISYDKGASLVAMVQDFLGESNFQKGLQDYLKTHSYGNAQTANLWESLQKASTMDKNGLTVKAVMETWTLQMGYPVVTIKRKPGTTDQLVVSQSRFLMGKESNEDKKFESPFNYVWKVPVTYITQTDQQKKLAWLTEEEMTLPVTLGSNHWIKANVGSRGFYRVSYEPSLWQLIIEQLKENMTVFSVRDRAGLLDDAFSLSRAGLLSYEIVFDLLGYFNQERDYVPMKTVINQYGFIMDRLYLTEAYPKLQKYMGDLISGCLGRLGWKEQTQHLDKLLQYSLLNFAITLDDEDTIEQARRHFTNLTGIPDNLRSLVYNMGVKYGDDETWQSIFKHFTTATVPTEKKQFLVALTYTTDPRRIQLFLNDSLNNEVVRSQDLETVINGFGRKKASRMYAWRFVQLNWDTFYERYGGTYFILEHILGVIEPFNTQFDYDEVTQFFQDKELGGGRMALKQSLEAVQSHIDWTKEYEEVITKWFAANAKDRK